MKHKPWQTAVVTVLLGLSVALVVWKNGGSEERVGEKTGAVAEAHTGTDAALGKAKHGTRSESRGSVGEAGPGEVRRLDLPSEKLTEGDKDELALQTTPQRSSGPMADDAILMAGGVLPKAGAEKIAKSADVGVVLSLKSAEWQHGICLTTFN